MISKSEEKQKAILLRQRGKTYSEILSEVSVAKSTLSLWLREVKLCKRQTQAITEKKIESQKKGALARKSQRLESTKIIQEEAMDSIGSITKRELFLLGIALYWAEGSKEKSGGASTMVDFANSDPAMVKIFVQWLLQFGGVQSSEIVVRLHLHETAIGRHASIRTWWSQKLNIPLQQFVKTNIKRHKVNTKRKNIGTNYYGLVSIRVRKSTNLNRRIQGLIYGIIAAHKNCRFV